MVGVGSGSALNAFNIGQQATQPTAIGMAIKNIVDNADKQGLLEVQSGAQTAGALATAKFKNTLAEQPQDVLVQNPDGSFTKVTGAPGGKKSILGMPQMTQLQKFQPGTARPSVIDFSTGSSGQSTQAEFVNVPGLGAIDPNAKLTEEQVAAIEKALNQ